jgi:hypothetical protein
MGVAIRFYATEADANAQLSTNIIGSIGGSSPIQPINGFINWKEVGTGNTYTTGDTINDGGDHDLYPNLTSGNAIYYFEDEATANTSGSSAYNRADTLSGAIGGQRLISASTYSAWRIASSSTGTFTSRVYGVNAILPNTGIYYLYAESPAPSNNVYYFANQSDAASNTGPIYTGNGGSALITTGGFTSWKIDPTLTTGSESNALVYGTGAILNNDGEYYIYPVSICFLEGSKILCNVNSIDTYLPVEELRKGTLVKTKLDGYKAVELIGKSTVQNPGNDDRIEDRLYKCSPANYPDLTEDLYLTGAHSILVPTITDEQREQINKFSGRVFVTDRMYRLPAWIDSKSEAWNSEGRYTVWHFALENVLVNTHYGVYANGLLVESCSIHSMKNKANITFV